MAVYKGSTLISTVGTTGIRNLMTPIDENLIQQTTTNQIVTLYSSDRLRNAITKIEEMHPSLVRHMEVIYSGSNVFQLTGKVSGVISVFISSNNSGTFSVASHTLNPVDNTVTVFSPTDAPLENGDNIQIVYIDGDGSVIGVLTDFNLLINKPSISGHVLQGDSSLEDIGAASTHDVEDLQVQINGIQLLGSDLGTFDNYQTPQESGNTTVPMNISGFLPLPATTNDFVFLNFDETISSPARRSITAVDGSGNITWSSPFKLSTDVTGKMSLIVGGTNGNLISQDIAGDAQDSGIAPNTLIRTMGNQVINGNLDIEGNLTENNQRVYSPNNKPTAADIGALALNQTIPNGSDLNTYLSEGLFSITTFASAATILNTPIQGALTLDVRKMDVDKVVQTAVVYITGNTTRTFNKIIIDVNTTPVYGDWIEQLNTTNRPIYDTGMNVGNGEDYNNFTNSGIFGLYQVATPRLNAPINGHEYGQLIVYVRSNVVTQEVFHRIAPSRRFVRHTGDISATPVVWTSWVEVLTTNNGLSDKGSIANGTDFDTIRTAGIYGVQASSNAATMLNIPFTGAGGILRVYYVSTVPAATIQEYTTWGANALTARKAQRVITNSGAGAWQEILTSANLQTTLTVDTDFNTVTIPGFYSFISTVNAPPIVRSWYSVIVTRANNDANYVQQIATHHNSGRVFIRVIAGSSWTAWKEITSTWETVTITRSSWATGGTFDVRINKSDGTLSVRLSNVVLGTHNMGDTVATYTLPDGSTLSSAYRAIVMGDIGSTGRVPIMLTFLTNGNITLHELFATQYSGTGTATSLSGDAVIRYT